MQRIVLWLMIAAMVFALAGTSRSAIGPGDRPIGSDGNYCLWRFCYAGPYGCKCIISIPNSVAGFFGLKAKDCGCKGPKAVTTR